jgi:site-specific recombinase XerD
MTAPRSCSRQPKQLDAGIFQAEISSFALRLAAEGKAAKTIRTYTEAVQWFAAARLTDHDSRTAWEQVSSQDIQRWMAWLLDRYSTAYASNQYRALQQFFKWLAAEDQLPDPMAGLQSPRVTGKLLPVFTPEDLARLERACAGRSFAQHRDTAIIAVLKAIRLSELAGLRCVDVDLWQTLRRRTGFDAGGVPEVVPLLAEGSAHTSGGTHRKWSPTRSGRQMPPEVPFDLGRVSLTRWVVPVAVLDSA